MTSPGPHTCGSVRPYCVQITPGLCVVAVFFNDTLNTYVYQEQLIKGPNINTSWRHTLSVYFPPAERQNGWLHLMCFKSHVIYYISNANIKHPERALWDVPRATRWSSLQQGLLAGLGVAPPATALGSLVKCLFVLSRHPIIKTETSDGIWHGFNIICTQGMSRCAAFSWDRKNKMKIEKSPVSVLLLGRWHHPTPRGTCQHGPSW